MTTQPSSIYPVGKLPQADLVKIIRQTLGEPDPRVIFGPGLGRDAAVIDYGDSYLVAKSDPITFATDEIGWYAVNVNANDIACMGARPRWFLATVLLPEGQTDRALIQRIADQLHEACREIGVALVGGHTEITYGLHRPIIIGAMLGEVSPDRLVYSDGAQPGDRLVLTKGIAVEGTAILAQEIAGRLQDVIPAAMLKRAAGFLHDPGISVVRDAHVAIDAGEVHALHDPTEGGVATGIYEMIEGAGIGADINAADLPIYPETRAFCRHLGLDPLGLIASGSLLASVAASDTEAVVAALRAAGIPAAIIGTTRAGHGVTLHHADGSTSPLPRFARDEIACLFETPLFETPLFETPRSETPRSETP